MSWNRPYDLFLILTPPGRDAVWRATGWEKVREVLDPFMRTHRKTTVSVVQSDERDKPISFGRLSWSKTSDMKWVSVDSADAPAPHGYSHIELWAPSRGECERTDRPPDLFFSVTDGRYFYGPGSLYGQEVILAGAADLGPEFAGSLRIAHDQLRALLGSSLSAKQQRRWDSSPSIMDLPVSGVLKTGAGNQPPLELASLEDGAWVEL